MDKWLIDENDNVSKNGTLLGKLAYMAESHLAEMAKDTWAELVKSTNEGRPPTPLIIIWHLVQREVQNRGVNIARLMGVTNAPYFLWQEAKAHKGIVGFLLGVLFAILVGGSFVAILHFFWRALQWVPL